MTSRAAAFLLALVVSGGTAGAITITDFFVNPSGSADMPYGGTTDFIVDVVGYFY